MQTVKYYLLGLLINALIIWMLISGLGYAVHDVKHLPMRGDLRAVYLPLTAFSYTAHMITTSAVIFMLNWQITRVFYMTHEARKMGAKLDLHRHKPIYFAASLILVFAGAGYNKLGWWVKLVFGNDRYGYFSVAPSVASLICTMGAIGMICASLWQIKGRRRALILTGLLFLVTLKLSLLAAYKVEISLV